MTDEAIRKLAKSQYVDDDLQIEEGAFIDHPLNSVNSAWVQAWVWVTWDDKGEIE